MNDKIFTVALKYKLHGPNELYIVGDTGYIKGELRKYCEFRIGRKRAMWVLRRSGGHSLKDMLEKFETEIRERFILETDIKSVERSIEDYIFDSLCKIKNMMPLPYPEDECVYVVEAIVRDLLNGIDTRMRDEIDMEAMIMINGILEMLNWDEAFNHLNQFSYILDKLLYYKRHNMTRSTIRKLDEFYFGDEYRNSRHRIYLGADRGEDSDDGYEISGEEIDAS